ncbi:MAG: ATPase, T2SS/T4P/T4SS family [Bacillota bacterium]|nr:ATPase, T2SS/T4P/T4SS family [Bacillota bacterium]
MKELTENVREIINSSEEPYTDEEVLCRIEGLVLHGEATAWLHHRKKAQLIRDLFNATRKELDVLQPYGDDSGISEIMVNGKDAVFIERQGRIEKVPTVFEEEEELEELIRRLAGRVHREINELSPVVSARLEDGSRVNAVHRCVALNGPILNIRKFPPNRIRMEELLKSGTLTMPAAKLLEKLVAAGYNIFISGGTSSGKTTMLNILASFIPPEERVIVIEDSAELQIEGIENLVRLEARNANVQGKGEVSMRELIRASLRMRPDRIIVGEVRGAEVLDMVQAMNTGHDGSLSTGHGNSPEGMLLRLEMMFLTAASFPAEAIRRQLAEAVDIIVHMGRLPDRSRKVLEIAEVDGFTEGGIGLRTLFRHESGKGLQPTGAVLKNQKKLELRGIEL